MQPPLFELRQVGKRFGRVPVLQGLSCELAEGEAVLLLGSNGSGKSTLLTLLATLSRPSAGELWFRGRRLYARGVTGDIVRRELGMVAHDSRFYGDLTARENLRLFGTLYGRTGLGERIGPVLEQARLQAVPDVPVRTFSSGMLKRLALARLLLIQPRVLLLDEPYSGLDQGSIGLFDDYLARFTAQGGSSVLVTHQFTPGVALCRRALVLQQGRLVYNHAVENLDAEACARLAQQHANPSP